MGTTSKRLSWCRGALLVTVASMSACDREATTPPGGAPGKPNAVSGQTAVATVAQSMPGACDRSQANPNDFAQHSYLLTSKPSPTSDVDERVIETLAYITPDSRAAGYTDASFANTEQPVAYIRTLRRHSKGLPAGTYCVTLREDTSAPAGDVGQRWQARLYRFGQPNLAYSFPVVARTTHGDGVTVPNVAKFYFRSSGDPFTLGDTTAGATAAAADTVGALAAEGIEAAWIRCSNGCCSMSMEMQ